MQQIFRKTDALVNFEKILWIWNDDRGEIAKRYKRDEHPLKYLWCEIVMISWNDVFSFGATIIGFCAAWWALTPHKDEHLVAMDSSERRALYQQRRQKMLSEKIDCAKFLTYFIENYPQSAEQTRKADISFWDRFK